MLTFVVVAGIVGISYVISALVTNRSSYHVLSWTSKCIEVFEVHDL